MTHVLVISGSNLDSYYEQTMDYIFAKYHTYPTSLDPQVIDPTTMGEIKYYEKLARDIAEEAQIECAIHIGKHVV